ncbi:MAG: hypothetical protein DRQ42_00640 [Gammaproteobacteria bacterium]|nr:MAG: hypothetical protein DRQ42_00640 [Gammaproteobacteria bacterium]
MKITKTDLLSVLDLVKPAIAKKETLETMTHYIFTGEDVVTYNDKICIHHPFKMELEAPFSVKADLFYKVVASVDSEDIDMEIIDGNIMFNSERSKGRFATKTEDIEVSDRIKTVAEEFSKYDWFPLPKDFSTAVNLLKFSADKDKTNVLSCMKFEGDSAYCGSESRMGWYEFEKGTLATKEFLVDAESMAELSNFRNIKEMCITEKWIHFAEPSEVIYSIRKRMGEYLNADKVFTDFTGEELKFPQTIKEDVSFVSIMVDDMASSDKCINFQFEPDNIILTAAASEGLADIVRTCENPTEIKGKLSFDINPIFFNEVIGNTLGGEGQVLYSKKAILIKLERLQHLIALIR